MRKGSALVDVWLENAVEVQEAVVGVGSEVQCQLAEASVLLKANINVRDLDESCSCVTLALRLNSRPLGSSGIRRRGAVLPKTEMAGLLLGQQILQAVLDLQEQVEPTWREHRVSQLQVTSLEVAEADLLDREAKEVADRML